MNFFAAQDLARRTTRRLVAVYVLATVLIVFGVTATVGFALYAFTESGYGASPGAFVSRQSAVLWLTAIAATVLILGATLYKTAVLSAGGGRVATDLGGTLVPADVSDPLRRRLRNVVEEMAIASGVPVPEIYVLELERGINAFAAGYEPGDAAVAVTRGALELLDRDELQGVIGHEFSHILNGDMRLNIRLMGVLFGIMVLGLAGRLILRSGRFGALVSSRRNRAAPVVLVIGAGLAVLGGIGVLLARLIKAGVSRQREYLADASAVQFTRQTDGIAGALKKIGGFEAHSYLQAADPEEVSHMLFGAGSRLGGLFATHPPLTARIRALDPAFRPEDYPVVNPLDRPTVTPESADRHTGFAAGGPAAAPAADIPALVGRPGIEHVAFATRLRESLPERLYEAAHSSGLAYLLVFALVLDRSGRALGAQMSLLEQQLGRERATLIRQFYDELAESGAEFRLPLLEIAFPALKRRPAPQLQYLIELAGGLIDSDGEIGVYEYCFYRILVANLDPARHAARVRRRLGPGRAAVRRAAIDLLRVVARHGHEDEAAHARP